MIVLSLSYFVPPRAGSGGQDPVLEPRARQQVRILPSMVDTCGPSGTGPFFDLPSLARYTNYNITPLHRIVEKL